METKEVKMVIVDVENLIHNWAEEKASSLKTKLVGVKTGNLKLTHGKYEQTEIREDESRRLETPEEDSKRPNLHSNEPIKIIWSQNEENSSIQLSETTVTLDGRVGLNLGMESIAKLDLSAGMSHADKKGMSATHITQQGENIEYFINRGCFFQKIKVEKMMVYKFNVHDVEVSGTVIVEFENEKPSYHTKKHNFLGKEKNKLHSVPIKDIFKELELQMDDVDKSKKVWEIKKGIKDKVFFALTVGQINLRKTLYKPYVGQESVAPSTAKKESEAKDNSSMPHGLFGVASNVPSIQNSYVEGFGANPDFFDSKQRTDNAGTFFTALGHAYPTVAGVGGNTEQVIGSIVTGANLRPQSPSSFSSPLSQPSQVFSNQETQKKNDATEMTQLNNKAESFIKKNSMT